MPGRPAMPTHNNQRKWITVNRTDYSRPHWFARWGWALPALCIILIAANLAFLIAGTGGPLNWVAVAVCSVSAIQCFFAWRSVVADDRAHRAFMRAHRQRMAEMDARWNR